MDGSGNLYAGNGYTDHTVTKLNSQATPIATWGTGGKYAAGVAYDGAGNIYVANYQDNSIQQYSTAGVPGISWTNLNNPWGMTINGGTLYAGGILNFKLTSYDLSGTFLNEWGLGSNCECVGVDGLGRIYAGGGGIVQRFNSSGLLQTQWNVPYCYGIGFDASNNIYIADFYNGVRIFSP